MFILSNTCRNLGRYARRYVPFGLMILFLLTVNIAVRCVRRETDAIVTDTLDQYGSRFYVVDLNQAVTDRHSLDFLQKLGFVISVRPAAALHNIERSSMQGGLLNFKRDRMLIGTEPSGSDFEAEEGRMFENDAECCLNRSYYEFLTGDNAADFDGLGDTLAVTDPRTDFTSVFTVVGILPDTGIPYSDPNSYTKQRIYTTMAAVEAYWKKYSIVALPSHMNDAYESAAQDGTLKEEDIDLSYMRVIEGYETIIELDSYQSAGALREAIREENARPAHSLRTRHRFLAGETVSGIDRLSAPMERVGKLCQTIDSVTLVVSLCIMLLLTVLLVMERRYEIGILRCLGISARGVCARFTLELLLFLLLVTALSFAAGIPCARLIARALSIDVAYSAVLRTGADTLLLLGSMGLLSAAAASAAVLSRRPMEILNSRTG